ncbi:MAG: hypothetical protein M1839_006305 [Geoglossum umbratile]|nr:MAG: hypothetical protein M1839_006305 [Geoglossum umbratile]
MGLEQCLSRLAYVPWILIVMSLAWWVWLLDAIWFQGARRTRNSAVGLWMMVVDTGPYGWKQCVTRRFLVILYLVLFGTAGVTSYGALRDRQFTLGILNAVGIALLAADAGGQNKYCKAPHLYQADNLRIPLTTTFNAAMVYVLPSRHYGFDAVHSPKIEYEHRSLDAKIALLFGPLAESGSKWSAFECGFNMRQIVNDHNKNIVRLADEQLINLAKWLYCKSDDRGIAVMRSIRCDRRDGVNLIGRELIMALLHAEYLLFELRERLPPDLNNEWSRLRNAKYSGQGDNIEPAAGFARTGKEGYQDAVSFIYKIFGLSVPDPSALDPEGPPPDRSEALSLEPESINDYVGKLWDMCCKADSTTLGAM